MDHSWWTPPTPLSHAHIVHAALAISALPLKKLCEPHVVGTTTTLQRPPLKLKPTPRISPTLRLRGSRARHAPPLVRPRTHHVGRPAANRSVAVGFAQPTAWPPSERAAGPAGRGESSPPGPAGPLIPRWIGLGRRDQCWRRFCLIGSFFLPFFSRKLYIYFCRWEGRCAGVLIKHDLNLIAWLNH